MREGLALEAREMLSARMLRHGEQMTVLMTAVVLLNYEVSWLVADRLAQEPKLGRPAPGDKATLNALLPPRFFEHQDELTARSRTLAAAAKERNDAKLVEAFAAVAKTCVGCHSVYLHDESPDSGREEPGEPTVCDPGDSCAKPLDDRSTRASGAPSPLTAQRFASP